MAACDFEHGKSRSGWWEWGDTKQALEFLFWAGHITTATRRGSFERVYDLTERVIPAAILALPTPEPAEAHRRLIELSARAHGVATAADLRDYFRLKPEEAKPAIEALVEDGALLPVTVAGWRQPAFLHAEARRPRRIRGQALLAPFDPLIWERARTERLFGFRYRIEIYTPADKRQHGYYVLPFLMDEALVARVDLKSDRQAGRLIARNVHLEPDAPPDTRERLAAELRLMADWLGPRSAGALLSRYEPVTPPRVGGKDERCVPVRSESARRCFWLPRSAPALSPRRPRRAMPPPPPQRLSMSRPASVLPRPRTASAAARNTPNLAGQQPGYLAAQLRAFKAGTRRHDLMQAIAAQLSDEQIDALAQYWHRQPAAGAAAAHGATAAAAPGHPVAHDLSGEFPDRLHALPDRDRGRHRDRALCQ